VTEHAHALATHDTHCGELAAGLAIARGRRGLTFCAVRAAIAPAPVLLAAWPERAAVSWSDAARVVVGIDVAREVRGRGANRWQEIIAGARDVAIAGATLGDVAVPDPRELGLARPRWLGGAAFAPNAADRAPWIGFGDAWFVLPRWTYVHDGARALLVLAVDDTEARDGVRWQHELARHRAALAGRFVARPQPDALEVMRGSEHVWRAQVEAITAAIASGACAKVVAARACTVTLAGPARAADLLATLDARHADCVRVLVRPPDAATLVAASPERLVRRTGARIECDALAGTIRVEAGDERTLLASTKDRREHELVVSAIRDQLERLGAHLTAPAEPIVRALRHVVHLHTPITAVASPAPHVLELAARLHPTPAVGGTPTDVALEWIRAHEPVARGWYASPVGWFDLDGDGELAVAIRSGVLAGHRAHLWAGAGIVAGSRPELELAETELKLRAMLGALGIEAGIEPARATRGGDPKLELPA
jgi:isochorismate synthase